MPICYVKSCAQQKCRIHNLINFSAYLLYNHNFFFFLTGLHFFHLLLGLLPIIILCFFVYLELLLIRNFPDLIRKPSLVYVKSWISFSGIFLYHGIYHFQLQIRRSHLSFRFHFPSSSCYLGRNLNSNLHQRNGSEGQTVGNVYVKSMVDICWFIS